MKKMTICILLGGLVFMCSCNAINSTELSTTSLEKEEKSTSISDFSYKQAFIRNNDSLFIYDFTSSLHIEMLKDISVLSSLYHSYPYFALRENNGQYYTIYSLSDNELCYVIIEYLPTTGITYAVKDYVKYPFQKEEDSHIYDFLLEKDYPENILGISK